MTTYTFSEARQQLGAVLDEAQRIGAVRIQRRDGSEFEISATAPKNSALNVEGIAMGLTAEEIVDVVREARRG